MEVAVLDLSEKTEALVRKLAEERHMSVDEVVEAALEHQAIAAGLTLASEMAGVTESQGDRRRRILDGFARLLDAAPDLDSRTSEEIMSEINER